MCFKIFGKMYGMWLMFFLLVLCIVENIITAIVRPNNDITLGLLAFRFFVRIGRTIQVIRHQRQYSKMHAEGQEVDFSRVPESPWDSEENTGNYISVETTAQLESLEKKNS